jgi:hypothetical protein
VTDKELKKLSRLELLELLLNETRENEKLREELDKIKKENSIEKSAQLLNETAKQLDETLKRLSLVDGATAKANNAPKKALAKGKLFSGKKSAVVDLFSKNIFRPKAKNSTNGKRNKK